MRVLIAFASDHGSTREIAERIGQVVSGGGLQVDVRSAAEVRTVDGYDAVVIGSAVHDRQWLAPAKDLVHRCAGDLARRPVYLFSVGMPGALRRPLKRWAYAEEPELLAQFDRVLKPIAHRLFSGVIAPDHLSRTGRVAFRSIGGRYGDYRDWPEIKAWAAYVANEVEASGNQP